MAIEEIDEKQNPVRTLLILSAAFLSGAGLVWIPVFIYAAHYNHGQRDMGGAFLAAVALFFSGVLVIVCLGLAVAVLVVFLLRRKGDSRVPAG